MDIETFQMDLIKTVAYMNEWIRDIQREKWDNVMRLIGKNMEMGWIKDQKQSFKWSTSNFIRFSDIISC